MFSMRNALISFVFIGLASFLSADEFKDTDWNIGFYDNCRLPCTVTTDQDTRPKSITWYESLTDRQLAFSVIPGDVGGCSSDSQPRDGAKYWERAEIIQYQPLADNHRYEISFQARFDKGFAGKRETFFQLHGWSKSCNAAPLMMLQFDWRHLKAQVLALSPEDALAGHSAARGDLQRVAMMPVQLDTVKSRDNRFEVIFDRTVDPNTVSLALNGMVLFENQPIHVVPCAEPRIKFGIYRPGGLNPGASRWFLDKVMVSHVEEGTCPAPPPDLNLDQALWTQ